MPYAMHTFEMSRLNSVARVKKTYIQTNIHTMKHKNILYNIGNSLRKERGDSKCHRFTWY